MLDIERQRPWAKDEIVRALNASGDIPESLRRLHTCKLIHHWNDLTVAAHATVRFHEISQAAENLTPSDREERHWEHTLLDELIVHSTHDQRPRTLEQTYEAFDATKQETKLKIADALDRLHGAGLIDRHAGHATATPVARRPDELLTV